MGKFRWFLIMFLGVIFITSFAWGSSCKDALTQGDHTPFVVQDYREVTGRTTLVDAVRVVQSGLHTYLDLIKSPQDPGSQEASASAILSAQVASLIGARSAPASAVIVQAHTAVLISALEKGDYIVQLNADGGVAFSILHFDENRETLIPLENISVVESETPKALEQAKRQLSAFLQEAKNYEKFFQLAKTKLHTEQTTKLSDLKTLLTVYEKLFPTPAIEAVDIKNTQDENLLELHRLRESVQSLRSFLVYGREEWSALINTRLVIFDAFYENVHRKAPFLALASQDLIELIKYHETLTQVQNAMQSHGQFSQVFQASLKDFIVKEWPLPGTPGYRPLALPRLEAEFIKIFHSQWQQVYENEPALSFVSIINAIRMLPKVGALVIASEGREPLLIVRAQLSDGPQIRLFQRGEGVRIGSEQMIIRGLAREEGRVAVLVESVSIVNGKLQTTQRRLTDDAMMQMEADPHAAGVLELIQRQTLLQGRSTGAQQQLGRGSTGNRSGGNSSLN